VLMRQVRSAMVESLQSDYVRTARAKGLSEARVVGIHALRNSLITAVTIVGLELGALISGSVVTEQIFLIPGFGRLVMESIFTRDYPLIQGVALFSACGYILLNFLVDALYSLLNPRIRVSRFSA
jgi:peptide/nickel transport system permease protein